jgi:sortase A
VSVTAPGLRRASGHRRRPLLRRLALDLSSVLVISGVLLLADAVVTVLWQEPLTALIAHIRQDQVDRRLLSAPATGLSGVDRQALAALRTPQRIAFLARRELRRAAPGQAIGRMRIPRLGVSFLLIQGTDGASLQKGPGHYPSTSLPGLGQTVAIAGHRTTYLAPFRHLDALRPGDRIVLKMPYGRFIYAVQFTRIVAPDAWWVTRNVGYDRVVLSACHPLYSARQRIVVFARLGAVVPFTSALGPILPSRPRPARKVLPSNGV